MFCDFESLTPTQKGTRVEQTQERTAGVDWGSAEHAAVILAQDGTVTRRLTVPDTAAGHEKLVLALREAQVAKVGIERSDGPLVASLLAAGFSVCVVESSRVRGYRLRYGTAANKDDLHDAFVLADAVRTDQGRLVPLVPDSGETVALRRLVRARKGLVEQRVAVANQLRSHLVVYYPAGQALFVRIDSKANLAFLRRFPTQQKADWLSPRRMQRWVESIGYSGRVEADRLYEKLSAAPSGVVGVEADGAAVITLSYVAILETLKEQIATLTDEIDRSFAAHPDAPIFASLPRSGTLRAARLLAEIGDARGRFPTADSLACLAGVVPSTRQSGKSRVVTFRYVADKKLRDALCDFAGDTRKSTPWAAELYEQARNRGHTHQHAVRVLGRSWSRVIWRCWRDGALYDPDVRRDTGACPAS